jgi:hypothetical protein
MTNFYPFAQHYAKSILMEKVCNHLPSGNTCRIFRYEVVSRMIEALSNCDVIALGSGRSFASSRNSAFSFSRRDRAAFLLFSFMAQRADKPKPEKRRKSLWINKREVQSLNWFIQMEPAKVAALQGIISLFNMSSIIPGHGHHSEERKIYSWESEHILVEIELHWEHKKLLIRWKRRR